jgi:hypothetical protein
MLTLGIITKPLSHRAMKLVLQERANQLTSGNSLQEFVQLDSNHRQLQKRTVHDMQQQSRKLIVRFQSHSQPSR